MEKTNVRNQSTELISILNNNFQGKLNLARVKLIVMFVCSLCKVQTVSFEKLANILESHSQTASSLKRIQRFIAR